MVFSDKTVMYICYVHGFAAYFTNVLLFYLIINYSRKELGTYKYLMLLFTTCNVIFPIISILAMPAILAVVMFHFLYRYLAVSSPNIIGDLNKQSYIYVTLSILLNGLVWGTSFHCSSYQIARNK
ncbi:unnamed protein product, partial [Mesorhabditis spiculigera]